MKVGKGYADYPSLAHSGPAYQIFVMTRAILPILLALLLTWPVHTDAAPLSDDDKDDIARIETYLNGITTMSSRFNQRSSTGNVASGLLYLSRPGRMWFEYDPPAQILLVADGLFLVYVDRELEQISNVPISRTPLRVLIDDDVNLISAYDIAAIDRRAGTLAIILTLKEDPDGGMVRLLFADKPLQLKQWLIRDARGVEVRVSLLDLQRGMKLDPTLFQINPHMFEDVESRP